LATAAAAVLRRAAGTSPGGKERTCPVANTGVMSSRALEIPDDDLIRWRRGRLRRAGFEPALAELMACDCAMDLHALLGLVDRGCPPHLAARILAPLDGRPRPC
jgi:hypothetical protein